MVWSICDLPYHESLLNKYTQFELVGRIVQHCCLKNFDEPPMNLAYDLHGANTGKINRALAGMLRQDEMRDVPFFDQCRPVTFQSIFHYFPFGHLSYMSKKPGQEEPEPKPVFGTLDPPTEKRGTSRCIAVAAGRGGSTGDSTVIL